MLTKRGRGIKTLWDDRAVTFNRDALALPTLSDHQVGQGTRIEFDRLAVQKDGDQDKALRQKRYLSAPLDPQRRISRWVIWASGGWITFATTLGKLRGRVSILIAIELGKFLRTEMTELENAFLKSFESREIWGNLA